MWSADDIYIVAPDGQKLPGLSDHTINAMVENIQDMNNGWQWINRLSAYYQSDSENAISTSARSTASSPSSPSRLVTARSPAPFTTTA